MLFLSLCSLSRTVASSLQAAMITIEFSPHDIKRIRQLRYDHPHPRVRQRMDVPWLKSQGLRHQDIGRLCGVSDKTLCQYLRMYLAGGLSALQETRFYAPTSALEAHREELEAYFRKHPPASIKAAAEKIAELTTLRRSPSAVGRFLKSLGMRPRKVGAIPSKGDPDKQEDYRIKELEPRLAEAKQGQRTLFFVDAAHFVFAPFLGVLWSFARLFVKAPAGRQRFNVLGALNAITHELVLITNDTYINAASVCELLRKIAAMNIAVPVTLVLDNARYQMRPGCRARPTTQHRAAVPSCLFAELESHRAIMEVRQERGLILQVLSRFPLFQARDYGLPESHAYNVQAGA